MTKPYLVGILPAAQKDLKKIGEPHLSRIRGLILGLAIQPRPPRVKKLAGGSLAYRIRCGVYRILYEINDQVRTVEVFRVAHRREAYR